MAQRSVTNNLKNQNKAWIRRQKNQKFNTICRKSNVSTKDSERFYLKLLLYKIKGFF